MSATLVAVLAAVAGVWLLYPPPPVTTRRTPGRGVLLLAVGAAALLALPVRVTAPLLVLVPALLAGRLLWRRHQESRAAEANARRCVEVCDLLAAELAAGRTTEAALDEAVTAWAALRPVADAARLGSDVPTAFAAVAASPGASGLRLLGAAWAVSHRTGAGLRSGTHRVAATVRADQATRQVVAGELASARATARLMAGLPVLALLMGSGAGGDPWAFLLGTSWGLACLAAGLALGMAGLWWIELIARAVDS
ncbi:MAG TPA: type II secretion system protein [Nocardioides sp.]|jgi:tight adherence protein B|nr:type II secretion system protein [Nocardioides sp.]